MTHISDELPRLLTGEADHDTVLTAAEHLRGCPDCREELVSALVAHASLASAHRFAPEVVARDIASWFDSASPDDTSDDSSDDTASDHLDPAGDVADEHADPDDHDAAPQRPRPAEPALPDLSAVFAHAREDAASPTSRARAAARHAVAGTSRRTRYLAVAAAAAVIVGGGATGIALSSGGSGDSGTHQVALAAYDIGHTAASATMRNDGEMTVDAASLPHVSGQRYEIWLTDASRRSMKPVGWLGSDGKATLTVPSDLMGTYSYIEVSRQQVSTDSYRYSGISVLRGQYSS